MDEIIFQLPEGWRPSYTWGIPMMLTTDAGYTAAYYGTLATDGKITQNLGSTIREGFTAFEIQY